MVELEPPHDKPKPKLRLIDRMFGLIGVPSATNHGAAMREMDNIIEHSGRVQTEAEQLMLAIKALDKGLKQ